MSLEIQGTVTPLDDPTSVNPASECPLDGDDGSPLEGFGPATRALMNPEPVNPEPVNPEPVNPAPVNGLEATETWIDEAPALFPYGNQVGELYIPLSAYDTDTALARRVLDKLWPLAIWMVAIEGQPTLKIHACSELFRKNQKDEKRMPLYEIGFGVNGEMLAIEMERPEQPMVWTPNRKERREMGRKVASGQIIVKP